MVASDSKESVGYCATGTARLEIVRKAESYWESNVAPALMRSTASAPVSPMSNVAPNFCMAVMF